MCVYIYVYIDFCVCLCVYLCVCVCVSVCVPVCVCVCIFCLMTMKSTSQNILGFKCFLLQKHQAHFNFFLHNFLLLLLLS